MNVSDKSFFEGGSAQLRLVCLSKYAGCHYGFLLYKDTITSKHSSVAEDSRLCLLTRFTVADKKR